MQNEWVFVRRRAEQLFEEGSVKEALKLLRNLNRFQQMLLEDADEYEQTENC